MCQGEELGVAHPLAGEVQPIAHLERDGDCVLLGLAVTAVRCDDDSWLLRLSWFRTSFLRRLWLHVFWPANHLDLLHRLADALVPLAEVFNFDSILLAVPVYALISLLAFSLPQEIDLFVKFVFVVCHIFAGFKFDAAKVRIFSDVTNTSLLDSYTLRL